jgi:hypothetical protein
MRKNQNCWSINNVAVTMLNKDRYKAKVNKKIKLIKLRRGIE